MSYRTRISPLQNPIDSLLGTKSNLTEAQARMESEIASLYPTIKKELPKKGATDAIINCRKAEINNKKI